MIRYTADDSDLNMESASEFWISIQNGYVVLNWRAVTGRPMCHHLMLCKVWDVDPIKHLARELWRIVAEYEDLL